MGQRAENAKTTTSPPVVLEREVVDGSCPRCGAEELRAYPVNSEGGWFNVIKCQHCLLSVSRERGPRLGPIQLLSDLL
jgi:vanillate/4-hydroxybenzoate decarboxylase subunit D